MQAACTWPARADLSGVSVSVCVCGCARRAGERSNGAEADSYLLLRPEMSRLGWCRRDVQRPGLIALQELLTLLPCRPSPVRPRPFLRHLLLARNNHRHLASSSARSSPLSPLSPLSASSARRVRTHQRVKHALVVRPGLFLFVPLSLSLSLTHPLDYPPSLFYGPSTSPYLSPASSLTLPTRYPCFSFRCHPLLLPPLPFKSFPFSLFAVLRPSLHPPSLFLSLSLSVLQRPHISRTRVRRSRTYTEICIGGRVSRAERPRDLSGTTNLLSGTAISMFIEATARHACDRAAAGRAQARFFCISDQLDGVPPPPPGSTGAAQHLLGIRLALECRRSSLALFVARSLSPRFQRLAYK